MKSQWPVVRRFAVMTTFISLLVSCGFFTGKGTMSSRDGAQLTAAKRMISNVTGSMALQLEADGVEKPKAIALTHKARDFALAQSNSLVIGLRLTMWEQSKVFLGLTVANTSLLKQIMPFVVEGAVGAVKDVGIAAKGTLSGKIMKSGMMSIKTQLAGMAGDDLVTLNSSMATSGIKGLSEAGMAAGELAAAVTDVASSSVASMGVASIPSESLAKVAGAIAMGAMGGLNTLSLSPQQMSDMNMAGAVMGGAVSGLAGAGLSADMATAGLKEITVSSVNALTTAGFTDQSMIQSAIGNMTTAAVQNLDATLFAGNAVVAAMGAISTGIGVGCTNLAANGGIQQSELSGLLTSASANIAQQAVQVAQSFGVSESTLAQTLAQKMLEGVSQGGGSVATLSASVTSAISDQHWSTDVTQAVATGATAAATFDTALSSKDTMPLCTSFAAMSEAALESVAATLPVFCKYAAGQTCPATRIITAGSQYTMWDSNFSGFVCSLSITAVPGVVPTPVPTPVVTSMPAPTIFPAPVNVAIPTWSSHPYIQWDPVTVAGSAVNYRLFYSLTGAATEASSTLDLVPLSPSSSPLAQMLSTSDIAGLSAASFMCIRIAAIVDGHRGSLSNQICKASMTSSPYGNVVSGASPGTINVTWSSVALTSSYDLYYSTSAPADLSLWTKVTGVTSPYVLTALNPGTYYSIRMGANINAGGSSLESIQTGASGTTATAGPSDVTAPTVGLPTLTLSADGRDGMLTAHVGISWNPATDNDSSLYYRVVRGNTYADVSNPSYCAAASGTNIVADWTLGMGGTSATGLLVASRYWFNVCVRDTSGNLTLYTPIVYLTPGLGAALSLDGTTFYLGYSDSTTTAPTGQARIVSSNNGSTFANVGSSIAATFSTAGGPFGVLDNIRLGVGSTNIWAVLQPATGCWAVPTLAYRFDGTNWSLPATGTFTGTGFHACSGYNTSGTFQTALVMAGDNPIVIRQFSNNVIWANDAQAWNGSAFGSWGSYPTSGNVLSHIAGAWDATNSVLRTVGVTGAGQVQAFSRTSGVWDSVPNFSGSGTTLLPDDLISPWSSVVRGDTQKGSTAIAIDGSYNPIVAYSEGIAGFAPHVRRFNGSSWDDLGYPTADEVSDVSLAWCNAKLYLLYKRQLTQGLILKYYDGSNWIQEYSHETATPVIRPLGTCIGGTTMQVAWIDGPAATAASFYRHIPSLLTIDFEDSNSLTAFGGTSWWRTTLSPHGGSYSARSLDFPSSGGSSCLPLTVDLTAQPSRTVEFWWRVSSESCCDYQRFYIDGVQVTQRAGIMPWEQKSFPLSGGVSHTLQWCYEMDSSVESGEDAAFVDDIVVY